jgi:hypothetical protein
MNTTKNLLTALFFLLASKLFAQIKYPIVVEAVLQKTKSNRPELEKALNYFYKGKDSLKIKAINFLVANMDIHTSYNYYWADSLGNRISYNELDYPSFDSSIRAFDIIKANTPKIHPVQNNYKDIDSIKGDYLIDNVEKAFAEWKLSWVKNSSFENFCEYVLPYRVSVEPLQNWRSIYEQRFAKNIEIDKEKKPSEKLDFFEAECNNWFTNTFNVEQRNEPLPRLGALQLLHRKKGACEDGADLIALGLRSQGIPATVDFVPYWATSSASHFLYSSPSLLKAPENILDSLGNPLPRQFRMPREPGKVLRTTYSKQEGALATILPRNEIPSGFLHTLNYKDVTDEYWETQNLDIPVNNTQVTISKENIAYACVFNTLDWRIIWWGKIKDNKAHFANMSKGAVYLPMQYTNNKLHPIGYPIASGYKHQQVLQPDTLHKHTIVLKEQEKYLKFHPSKKYKLYCWMNRWQKMGEQIATDTTTSMAFNNIPKNALLLMFPEDTKHKERPFIVTNEGTRVWF